MLMWAIPIVGIIVGCLIAIFAMYFNYKERTLKHRERLAAIEKGLPLPPEFETSIEERKRGLLTGSLITLFAGAGIFITLFILVNLEVASIGIIPFAIGIGMLLSSFLIKEKKK
ncbi:MAG: DUF6249 domain-containing protein [Candidatus Aminicenantia bacterium]